LLATVPELAALGEAAAATIANHVDAGDLAPDFSTAIRRAVWPVRFQDAAIEVALDQGEIRADDRRLPVCAVELDLESGHSRDIVDRSPEDPYYPRHSIPQP
jgi:triphosphatase